MIKCFTEGPKAFAKSSVCSETTIAVPACINYKCIYIFFFVHLRSTATSLYFSLGSRTVNVGLKNKGCDESPDQMYVNTSINHHHCCLL